MSTVGYSLSVCWSSLDEEQQAMVEPFRDILLPFANKAHEVSEEVVEQTIDMVAALPNSSWAAIGEQLAHCNNIMNCLFPIWELHALTQEEVQGKVLSSMKTNDQKLLEYTGQVLGDDTLDLPDRLKKHLKKADFVPKVKVPTAALEDQLKVKDERIAILEEQRREAEERGEAPR